MRRLALLALLGLAVAACGGTDPGASSDPAPAPAPPAPATTPAPPAQTPELVNEPTDAQLEQREELLAQIEAGTYADCGCTAAIRARDRIESGKAEAPDRDRLVSNLP